MANNPYDRTNAGVREKPLSGDINGESSQVDRTLRDTLMAILAPRTNSTSPASSPRSGFVSDGFQVVSNGSPTMGIQVLNGLGFSVDATQTAGGIGGPDLENVNDFSTFIPMVLESQTAFAVPAAPSGPNVRVDIIEVRSNRQLTDATLRLQLDPTTKTFAPKTFDKTLSYLIDTSVGTNSGGGNSTAALSYKVGTPGAADGSGIGTVPATTPGYIKIAEIQVASAATSITASNIVDRRKLLAPGGVVPFAAMWRLRWNSGTPVVTVLNIAAPPSVQVGCFPNGSVRGAATVFVTGGDFSVCSAVAQIIFPNASGSYVPFGLCNGPSGATANPAHANASGGGQAELAGCTPPIVVGSGTQAWYAMLESFALPTAGGAFSSTDTTLEEAVVSVSGLLSY